MSPLAIGMVCFPGLGGSGVIAADLAVGLAQRGHCVHVIASAPPSRPLPECDRLFFHEVNAAEYPLFDHAPHMLALASAIVEVATDQALDLVHVHYAVPHATCAYLARQVLGSAAPASITTLHGTDAMRVGADPSYRSVTRFAVDSSDGVTAPSQFLRQEAYRQLGLSPATTIEVIPNFVDTERFAPASERNRHHFDELFAAAGSDPHETGPVLFHVSNFRAVKRVADLLEVLTRVRRRLPARLVLVGDGPERAHAWQRARDLGITRNVCFLGKRSDFADHLRHADAFLLPSESESFGVAALEALSSGVPVVAYRVGGLPELVHDTVGRLVEPFDVDALANATLEIITDSQRQATVARAARVHVLEHFRREPAIERYEAYYRQVLEARRQERG